jgi:hypothetical protein
MDSDENSQGGEGDQRKPPPKTSIVCLFSGLKSKFHKYTRKKQKPATEHQRNERMTARWTQRLGFFTILLAMIGIVTAWILYETDQTARLTNRAFVAVRDLSSTAVGPARNGDDISYNISTVWENSGNTETRDLQIGGALLQVPVGSHPIPPLWSPSGDASSYILLPKATLPNFTLSIAGNDINKIRDIKYFVYMFGFAKYEDAFGKRHLTLACSRVFAGQVDYTKAGASGVGGLQCGEYNCADKECLRYKTGPFATPKLTELLKYIE